MDYRFLICMLNIFSIIGWTILQGQEDEPSLDGIIQKKAYTVHLPYTISPEYGRTTLLFLRDNGLWDMVFSNLEARAGKAKDSAYIELTYIPVFSGKLDVPLGSYQNESMLHPIFFSPMPYQFQQEEEKVGNIDTSDSLASILVPYPGQNLKVSRQNKESEEMFYKTYLQKAVTHIHEERALQNLFLELYSIIGISIMSISIVWLVVRGYKSAWAKNTRYLWKRWQELNAISKKVKTLIHGSEPPNWDLIFHLFKQAFSEKIPQSATVEEMKAVPLHNLSREKLERFYEFVQSERYSKNRMTKKGEFQQSVELLYQLLQEEQKALFG